MEVVDNIEEFNKKQELADEASHEIITNQIEGVGVVKPILKDVLGE